MNILSTFINSGEKRPCSESPTPDDPLETTVLTALQKFFAISCCANERESCGYFEGHH
eukprot:jgi/Botrbrau1/19988/Bobra.0796s0001.1